MMVVGEMLFTDTALVAYGPWFEASGDGAVFGFEVIANRRDGGEPGGNVESQLEVAVETKKLTDDDAAAVALTRTDSLDPWSVTFPGAGVVATARYVGFRELVRFKYSLILDGTATGLGMHFRMLTPMWECNCIACDVEVELESQVRMSS